MLRLFYLYLTDRRLRAALKTISACGAALGDLTLNPEDAEGFFKPHRLRLTRPNCPPAAPPQEPAGTAAEAQTSRAGSGAVAPATEDFTARLENFFCILALHKTTPDPAMREALLYLQAACAEAGALLSPWRRAAALAKIRGLTASAAKQLRLAKTAADAQRNDFPQNLKFSSMYSDLDSVFYAFERCACALYNS